MRLNALFLMFYGIPILAVILKKALLIFFSAHGAILGSQLKGGSVC